MSVARTLKIYPKECYFLIRLFLCGRKFTDFRLSWRSVAGADSAIGSLHRTNLVSDVDVSEVHGPCILKVEMSRAQPHARDELEPAPQVIPFRCGAPTGTYGHNLVFVWTEFCHGASVLQKDGSVLCEKPLPVLYVRTIYFFIRKR
jgi:hypothetical protein